MGANRCATGSACRIVSARGRVETDTAAMTEAAGFSRHLAHAKGWTRPVPGLGRGSDRQGCRTGPEMGARLSALEDRWVDSNFALSKDALLDSAD
jgi:poly(A) polymerase